MRSVKRCLLLVSVILAFLFASCGPGNIDSSYGGGGSPTPASVTVVLTPSTIASGGWTTVTATVTDSSSNPLSGITVDFAVSDGTAGSFSAASAVTDAAGVATVTFNANVVDLLVNITATVTLSGGGTINNSASLTIGAPPPPNPANISLTISPLSINIQGQATVTATATDSSGSPAFNAAIALVITTNPTYGSFDPVLDVDTQNLVADGNGQVTATFYADTTSGSVTITATATAVPVDIATTASLNITSVPATVTLVITPVPITSSGTANMTATVLNVASQPVPDGTTVTFTCQAGSCGIGTFPATATTVGGDASVTFTADDTVTGSATIQASAGTTPIIGTASITVNAAATSSIEFVSAAPQVIGIKGSGVQDYSVVTFLVKASNGFPKPGVLVDFTLALGPTGSYIGDDILTPLTDSASTDANGLVNTILHADYVAGPARILATVNGTAISTSSGNISIGGGVPSATHFDLAATRINLEGLDCLNVQSTISAFLADRFGNYNVLTGTSVSFATEAGAIDTSNVTDANGITSSVIRTQAPMPEDVDPAGWETAAGLEYTVGPRTYNPRDGYVTVLVTTTGEETFVDEDADGVYDPGETFTDVPEPFIDVDDDNVRDVGELFFDWPAGVTPSGANPVNPNGVYDTVNTEWDAQIPIYEKYTLVFTGGPDEGTYTSRIENDLAPPAQFNDVTIAPGADRDFYVYVSDINMNRLIAGTSITVSTTAGSLDVLPTNPFTTIDGIGGPTVLIATLKNDIAGSENIFPTLRASINYPGACNSVTAYLSFSGNITFTPPSAPAAPTGVTAVAGGAAGEIDVSWNNVTGATLYNLYWGLVAGTTNNQFPAVTSTYTHVGLTPGTTYYYTVTAVGPGGESVRSAEVSAIAP